MTKTLPQPAANSGSTAIACFNIAGVVPAWRSVYDGESGRVATIPDIISARLASSADEPHAPWNLYFTTASAEYLGVGAAGRLTLIVAHGVGPLSTLDGILKAYSHEYKDRNGGKRGGRITRAEFLKLERGEYGEVTCIDFQEYGIRYRYPFQQTLTVKEALADKLVAARLGPQYREYIERHARESAKYLRRYREISGRKQDYANPHILKMRAADHTSYLARMPEEGFAFAHLITIGQLIHTSVEERDRHDRVDSLTCDIHLHEWWNGVRLAGVRGKDAVTSISDVPTHLIKNKIMHPKLFMREAEHPPVDEGFYELMTSEDSDRDEHVFTVRSQMGDNDDRPEPEFEVTEIDLVERQTITVKIDRDDNVCFSINDVRAVAPPEANAFQIDGAIEDPRFNKKKFDVTFYLVTVDRTKRMLSDKEIYNDSALLQKLAQLSRR